MVHGTGPVMESSHVWLTMIKHFCTSTISDQNSFVLPMPYVTDVDITDSNSVIDSD